MTGERPEETRALAAAGRELFERDAEDALSELPAEVDRLRADNTLPRDRPAAERERCAKAKAVEGTEVVGDYRGGEDGSYRERDASASLRAAAENIRRGT